MNISLPPISKAMMNISLTSNIHARINIFLPPICMAMMYLLTLNMHGNDDEYILTSNKHGNDGEYFFSIGVCRYISKAHTGEAGACEVQSRDVSTGGRRNIVCGTVDFIDWTI